MAGQQQQQRAAIDQLKRENLCLQQKLLAGQQRQHAAADGPWLEGQVKLYKLKAHQEEQLAGQIQRELETIRQQLQLQAEGSSLHQQGVSSSSASSGSSSIAKQQVILQERLANRKQKLGSITAGNASKERALQDIAKCTRQQQLVAQQLHRQLCTTQAETESVEQLIAAVEATQHKAERLCKLLQSQDDAEHLAVSALSKQVSDLLQQQQQQQDAPGLVTVHAPGAADACECSCTEQEAQQVLDSLCVLLEEAGLGSLTSKEDSSREQDSKYAQLVRWLQRLESDNCSLFVQCSVADWHQQQQHQLAHNSENCES